MDKRFKDTWTKWQEDWFIFAYQELTWKELILLTGKSEWAMRKRGKELGFVKKARTLKCIDDFRNEHPAGYCKIKVNKEKKYLYIIIKTGQPNEWEYLHRLLYETFYGPIEKNEMVTFRDGNSLKCELKNLVKITKKEHILKHHKYRTTPEIRETKQALKELEKQIYQYGREQTT